jgi:hypothetical protein
MSSKVEKEEGGLLPTKRTRRRKAEVDESGGMLNCKKGAKEK